MQKIKIKLDKIGSVLKNVKLPFEVMSTPNIHSIEGIGTYGWKNV